jgi:hypothetical protein
MVVAPSAPVAWSPGTSPLSESLRARVRAGAGSAAERAIAVLPVSGRRVVAVPVDTAMRCIIGTGAERTGDRIAIPMGAPRGSMVAPWGEPDPVPGVRLRTSPVPDRWLRAPARTSSDARPSIGAPIRGVAPSVAATPPQGVTGIPVRRREPSPMPASVRVRKAAMMAFGLLVSLVAVEAAARVGRR